MSAAQSAPGRRQQHGDASQASGDASQANGDASRASGGAPAADEARAWRSIVDAASAPYRRCGRFAWHFARGKLRHDPVFRHLVADGLVAPRARVLDLGCGQGLLASVVGAAGAVAQAGGWPGNWADAPAGARVTGIEMHRGDVGRARTALGGGADVVCADLRSADFASADVVVILDVLHYLGFAAQDDVLRRVRTALAGGGRLVLRIGDAAARRGFVASSWVDRIVTLLRGQGVGRHCGRTLAEWRASLEALGFAVSSRPMRAGTPFANVLLVATLPAAATPPRGSPAAAAPAAAVVEPTA